MSMLDLIGIDPEWEGRTQVDDSWLRRTQEAPIDPGLTIIDPHHHLWNHSKNRYLAEEFRRDLADGHRVRATVHVEASSHFTRSGPPHLRPVGETQFVAEIGESLKRSNPAGPEVGAGIVAFTDLTKGDVVDEVLQAHIEAGRGRMRGIRNTSIWDENPNLQDTRCLSPRGLLGTDRFREGFSRLAAYGLSYDAWLYHPQLDELADLADTFPETTIIVDHLGAPLMIEQYALRKDEVFRQWSASMRDLARRPNIFMKISGLGMRYGGFGLRDHPAPVPSATLADLWGPFIDVAIDVFGPGRSMFASNFPVDKGGCSYRMLWNAFKRATASLSEDERADLFRRTAARVYRLEGFA
ncbi:amidohydrolase family protein [Bosea sp. OK403]|jgi:predicted TIM-barrel fold metal-dependent hydrolase|uniref:amidohydrolase family protein n=1 Tax=Bosea sp. OK403 TaxID=1855286 RepID=UPI0015877AD2|nr:amidohydrolase family protein [Bosea sp. OK403]